jgi:hypothetical protein
MFAELMGLATTLLFREVEGELVKTWRLSEI